VTKFPLKLKLKGIVSIDDHVGEALLPGKIVVHPEEKELELEGYSLSLFNPPGLLCVELGV
tara:strand:- start:350 stop:532 length:183 start_codon:yes stop_codon:yes gene_type:complete